MKVVIRVDGSRAIGTGHIVRCLTLAKALRSKAAQVSFIVNDMENRWARWISSAGYKVHRILINPVANFSWKRDADQTLCFLERQGSLWDVLIVDHYGLDQKWERAVRYSTRVLLVIDDICGRYHDCDILLNTSDYRTISQRSSRRRGTSPILLRGGAYALLETDFLKGHNRLKEKEDRPPNTVHVFFGGVDDPNYTERFSRWVATSFPNLKLQIVVSRWYPHIRSLTRLKKDFRGSVNWARNVKMALPMAKCDLALGTPGATTWERACLGLAPAYVSVAENQKPILRRLQNDGLCSYLGEAGKLTEDVFLKRFSAFLSDQCGLTRMRRNGMSMVDGDGVRRVVETVFARLREGGPR
ncbi:MAG: UDP-2,4-diacetamido-2,4,6-trideoxy-beta-L-altropyranose hydrolase [Elusimicrobia bacterium]|nr:UDP-2,4-diacetamido-2,4,6-trideoxy-beta-L-altropyranose hydrolase [Elusimicrobiota bacterium]